MKKKEIIRFITVEGIDGAGKSTTIKMIQDYLEARGEKVLLTREPGGSAVGEKLRAISQMRDIEISAFTETMLMFTARAQHIHEKIKPALDADMWVICDRFTDSTVAYQSAGKGVPEAEIKALETLVQKDIKPSLTLILDLPLEEARRRLQMTKKVPDRFESENTEFFEKVSNGYKDIFKKDPNRCKIIDSSQTEEITNAQVVSILDSFYSNYLKENPAARQMKFNF